MTPDRVGPYRVIGQLGAGGMGVVYTALSAETGERVALKTVRVPRQGLIAAIRREIRALMRVHHPGVVRVLAEGVEAGLPWYAMELLEGGTLRDHHQAIWKYVHDGASTALASRGLRPATQMPTTMVERLRPLALEANGNGHGNGNGNGNGHRLEAVLPTPRAALPPCGGGRLADALRPLAQLCRTLAFLHGEGIVHRDLKPENVAIREGGMPVLMDFGIVTHFGGALGREVLEVAGTLSGTAGYMAPEQIQGERVDARADLYAVGCLLYEIVTGLSAFGGETQEVLGHHLHSDPVPPTELVDGIPRALNTLILGLMAKRPRDRIGHADDVAAALEEWAGPTTSPTQGAAQEVAGMRVRDVGTAPTARAYLYRPELVGREDVRERLTLKVSAAEGGLGSCVYLGGESGVGKTALAAEVTRLAAQRGMQVIAGECVPLSGATSAGEAAGGPLHPFRPFLQAVADRCMERGAETTARLLGGRGQVLATIEPALVRVSAEMPKPAELPAEAARRRLLQTLAYTVAQMAEERPLLLVLDDLQWADELTLAFLTSLPPTWFQGKRLLVVVTYRADEVSPMLAEALAAPDAVRVDLPRLDARTVEAMVGEMLALPVPPPELVEYVARASEGNPFFVTEYLRAAVAEGLLTRDLGGHWRFVRAGGEGESMHLALPRGLRELVGRRLAGLPPLAQRIVEAGAVIGREFEAELVLGVAGLADTDAGASHALSELLVRHVLESDGAKLRFVHDKLREGAYELVAEGDRGPLHGAAARAIETRSGGSPQKFAELAHHFQLAGETAAALAYLEKSGEHSLRSSAHAAAAEAFARALSLDTEQGRRSELRQRARWAHGLSKAHFALGDLIAAETHARAALAQLGRPLPSSPLGWGRMLVSEALRQTWRLFGPARGEGELPPGEREDLSEAAHAASLMTHRFYYVGDSAAMIGASLLSVNLAERVGAGWQVPRSYSWLGYVVGLLRRHELAARYFARAHEGATRLDDTSELAFAHIIEAVYHIGFGAWDNAEERARRALALCDSDVQMREIVLTIFGHIEFYTARHEDSRRRYAELLASARTRKNEQHTTWALFSMGRALCAQRQWDDALPLLDEARERLERKSELDSEIICLGLLALVNLRRGELAAARRLADETLARVRRSRPASFAVVSGYDGAAEVLLELWSRGARTGPGDEALERGAVEIAAALGKLARLFPMAGSLAALHAGRVEELRGRTRRARRRYEEAARLADGLVMPRERALAAVALARTAN